MSVKSQSELDISGRETRLGVFLIIFYSVSMINDELPCGLPLAVNLDVGHLPDTQTQGRDKKGHY